jgi:hypothetical protein
MRRLHDPKLDLLLPNQAFRILLHLIRPDNGVPGRGYKQYLIAAQRQLRPFVVLSRDGCEAYARHEGVHEAVVIVELPCYGLFDGEAGVGVG